MPEVHPAKKKILRITPEVDRAISLLQKVAAQAIKGVGYYAPKTCPIAKGYGVIALVSWPFLSKHDIKKLLAAGWEPDTYMQFIHWYDASGRNHVRKLRSMHLRLVLEESC